MVRPLDLGIFLPNAKGGAIMATGSPPQYFPTWELNRKNALIAENAGFQFLLSMVKWRGFGGETGHWDYSLESFTLMAACAAVTSRIQLYASVAIPTVHPAVIAKMTATIDDISKGRFGVNISEKLSVDAKVTYIAQEIYNKPGVGGDGLVGANVYRIPTTVNQKDLKDYKTTNIAGIETPTFWTASDAVIMNPYWTVNNTHHDENRSRVIGLVSLNWKLKQEGVFGQVDMAFMDNQDQPIPLMRGDVAAICVFEPYAALAELNGWGKRLWVPYDSPMGKTNLGFVASSAFVKKDPELTRKMVAAHVKATKEMASNPSIAIETTIKQFKMTKEVAELSTKNLFFSADSGPAFVSGLKALAKMMLDDKMLEKEPNWDEFLNLGYA